LFGPTSCPTDAIWNFKQIKTLMPFVNFPLNLKEPFKNSSNKRQQSVIG
jgi:hypothetical protein